MILILLLLSLGVVWKLLIMHSLGHCRSHIFPSFFHCFGLLKFVLFTKSELWCRAFEIKCIIDLHAAPGSQNGMEHSASRDGTTGWPTTDNISETLDVIEFLASR